MPRFNFAHIEVDGRKTARFTLGGTGVNGAPDVVLICKPATEENKAYTNARLKAAQGIVRAGANVGVTQSVIEESRERERELYAAHVITGWENVCDLEGKPVECNASTLREFLDALPGWLFDDVRTFCRHPNNFFPDRPDKAAVSATAGN